MAERREGSLPPWLRTARPAPRAFRETLRLLKELRVETICEQARCPNKAECFSTRTASFLILGPSCTRACRFCAVGTSATRPPTAPSALGGTGADGGNGEEPQRIAAAVARLGLRHVVVTSVTRDDLPDGGARDFATTVAAVRAAAPSSRVELLIPDFGGDRQPLKTVLDAKPDVLAHNLETVARLSAVVRPRASYARSLRLLEAAADVARATPRGSLPSASQRLLVKTGLMVGLGEHDDEVLHTLEQCAAAGVDVVTIGQYLRPNPRCLPVARFVEPPVFALYASHGNELGLRVQAGPLVRSSYRAGELALLSSDTDAVG